MAPGLGMEVRRQGVARGAPRRRLVTQVGPGGARGTAAFEVAPGRYREVQVDGHQPDRGSVSCQRRVAEKLALQGKKTYFRNCLPSAPLTVLEEENVLRPFSSSLRVRAAGRADGQAAGPGAHGPRPVAAE